MAAHPLGVLHSRWTFYFHHRPSFPVIDASCRCVERRENRSQRVVRLGLLCDDTDSLIIAASPSRTDQSNQKAKRKTKSTRRQSPGPVPSPFGCSPAPPGMPAWRGARPQPAPLHHAPGPGSHLPKRNPLPNDATRPSNDTRKRSPCPGPTL